MAVTEPTLRWEEMDADADRAPRRWPLVVLALIVAAAVLIPWVEGRLKAAELTALVDRVSAGQRAVAQGDARVASMTTYGQPVLSRPSLDPALRSDVEQLVRDAQLDAASAVRDERAGLALIEVRPWHSDVRAAVAAYDDYLAASQAAFASSAQGGAGDGPELDVALALARQAAAVASAGDSSTSEQLAVLLSGRTGSPESGLN